MEKIFLNKRLVAIAFFTVFSTATVSAESNTNDHSVPVGMTFIRWVKDQPIFQLNFTGDAQHNDFIIVIKDGFNNILYRENIKSENFTKSFLLNTNEIGEDTLNFEIISKKSNKSEEFRVNRHTFVKEELA